MYTIRLSADFLRVPKGFVKPLNLTSAAPLSGSRAVNVNTITRHFRAYYGRQNAYTRRGEAARASIQDCRARNVSQQAREIELDAMKPNLSSLISTSVVHASLRTL
jgi:hypothetical protein